MNSEEEARQYWIDDWARAYTSMAELRKNTKHGPIIHVIEYRAYKEAFKLAEARKKNNALLAADIDNENNRLRDLLGRIYDCSTMGPELREEIEKVLGI